MVSIHGKKAAGIPTTSAPAVAPAPKAAEAAPVKPAKDTAYEKSSPSNTTRQLTPAAGHKATTPLGPWALRAPPKLPGALGMQRKAFDQMLQSPLPVREKLVHAAVEKRSVSIHAYYRGIADARTELMAKALPASNYKGGAGFVLSTGDMHLYQPATVTHPTQGVMMGVGDSDRVGFGPYEWDLRSLLTSVELEGRVHKFSPEDRQKAMRAMLDAYQAGIQHVATSDDPEAAAKELRVTLGNAPKAFKGSLEAADEASRKKWLAGQVVKGDPSTFRKAAGSLEALPTTAAGKAIVDGIKDALPRYVEQLPKDLQKKFKGLEVADVAIPFKGNGSLGYGRYRVLLAPPHGKNPSDMVVVEFKEQLPSALGKYVNQGRSEGEFGKDQASRAVSMFRAGTGNSAALDWGHVTLPKGCGVASSDFTVKEVHADEQGVDLVDLDAREFIAMASAQGRLLAGFQALGGVNGAASHAGTAKDILANMAPRLDFVKANIDGARTLADHFEAEAHAFKQAFG